MDDIVCTVKEIPLPSLDSRRPIFRVVYAMVLLVISPVGRGPYRVYVTDFTSNDNIMDQFDREKSESLNSLPSGSLLQLDTYQEQFRTLLRQYENSVGSELTSTHFGPSSNIVDKLCIVRATVRSKIYNGSLEGKVQSLTVINKESEDWDTQPNLTEMMTRMSRYPIVLKYVESARRYVVPGHINKTLSHSPDTRRHNRRDVSASQDFLSGGYINPSQSIPDSLRGEQLVGDLVPGDKYSHELDDDDTSESGSVFHDSNNASRSSGTVNRSMGNGNRSFRNSQGQVRGNQPLNSHSDFLAPLPDSTSSSHNTSIHNNSIQNTSIHNTSYQKHDIQRSESSKVYSVNEINNLSLDTNRGQTYSVRGIITGIVPEAISHICVKGYTTQGNQVVTTDPHLRPVQLLLADESVSAGTFVCQHSLLKIHLSPNQIMDSLKLPVEKLYTGTQLQTLQQIVGTTVSIVMYKKMVNVGDSQIPVWSCTSPGIDSLVQC